MRREWGFEEGTGGFWAPWEIRRTDLDSEEISKILERLRETGRLVIEGVDSAGQKSLFIDI